MFIIIVIHSVIKDNLCPIFVLILHINPPFGTPPPKEIRETVSNCILFFFQQKIPPNGANLFIHLHSDERQPRLKYIGENKVFNQEKLFLNC